MEPLTIEARDAEVAIGRSCEYLLALQDDGGWWQGELQTNVTMDAEDMLLREFLGIRCARETERTAAWIRSQQRADGTWSNFHGGPGDVSTTVEAYCALRLAGDAPTVAHMRSAAEFIRSHGGVEAARVFTHLWLALFGLWSWDRVPALPPEMMLLPPRFPLNIYDFACWARQTLVALSVVKAHRPVRPLGFDLNELQASDPGHPAGHGAASDDGSPPARGRAPGSAPRARGLRVLDRVLRAYERHPLGLLRRISLARAERWIVRRQEADGSWGGIQPPWVYSLMALQLRGYPLEHPIISRGLAGIRTFTIEQDEDPPGSGRDGVGARRLEACQSPVWDTALSLIALSDAGIPGDHPAMVSGARWLLGEEVTVRGDWAVTRPQLAPGGWAFEFANVNYPDVDDTAEVVLALRRVAHAAARARGGDASRRGGSAA